jgi:hypothetical protein
MQLRNMTLSNKLGKIGKITLDGLLMGSLAFGGACGHNEKEKPVNGHQESTEFQMPEGIYDETVLYATNPANEEIGLIQNDDISSLSFTLNANYKDIKEVRLLHDKQEKPELLQHAVTQRLGDRTRYTWFNGYYDTEKPNQIQTYTLYVTLNNGKTYVDDAAIFYKPPTKQP